MYFDPPMKVVSNKAVSTVVKQQPVWNVWNKLILFIFLILVTQKIVMHSNANQLFWAKIFTDVLFPSVFNSVLIISGFWVILGFKNEKKHLVTCDWEKKHESLWKVNRSGCINWKWWISLTVVTCSWSSSLSYWESSNQGSFKSVSGFRLRESLRL